MISLGLPTMQKVRLNTQYTLIFDTAIGYDPILPRWITHAPNAINTGNYDVDQCLKIILGTQIFVNGILDNTIPDKDNERKMEHLDHGAKDVTPDNQDEKFDVIYEFPPRQNIQRRQRNIIKYMTFCPRLMKI